MTSLTIAAPAPIAASATATFEVSIDTGGRRRRAPRHGQDPLGLLGGGDRLGAGPGRLAPDVEHIRPLAASSRPCAIAASGSRKRPPSENESGVTLTMPINFTAGLSLRRRRRNPGAGAAAAAPLALRPFGLRSRLGRFRLLLVVGEDLVRGLAVEQGDELLGVDRLPLEQELGDPVELLAPLVSRSLAV